MWRNFHLTLVVVNCHKISPAKNHECATNLDCAKQTVKWGPDQQDDSNGRHLILFQLDDKSMHSQF